MANQRGPALDGCFHALAHPIRRGMVERLSRGGATVGDLAAPFGVTAPTISKHLKVLEAAGLVRRERVGREHHLHLDAAPLREATTWFGRHQRLWEERLDALEAMLAAADDAAARRRPDRTEREREEPRS